MNKPAWNRLNPEKVSQIVELHREGRTYDEISSTLGVGRMTIRNYLHPEVQEPERLRRRDYKRLNRVGTTINGETRQFRARKRARPETCELCGRESIKLNWHHWDDDNLSLGLWLCSYCHIFAGRVEINLVERYLKLRDRIGENYIKEMSK